MKESIKSGMIAGLVVVLILMAVQTHSAGVKKDREIEYYKDQVVRLTKENDRLLDELDAVQKRLWTKEDVIMLIENAVLDGKMIIDNRPMTKNGLFEHVFAAQLLCNDILDLTGYNQVQRFEVALDVHR